MLPLRHGLYFSDHASSAMSNAMTTYWKPEIHDEATARRRLCQIRWPNGPICPQCSSTEVIAFNPRTKAGTKGQFKCRNCRSKFTVLKGTMFEGTHVRLAMWIETIRQLCINPDGLYVSDLKWCLGVSYRIAQKYYQKIDEKLVEPLLGGQRSDARSVQQFESCSSKDNHPDRGPLPTRRISLHPLKFFDVLKAALSIGENRPSHDMKFDDEGVSDTNDSNQNSS